MEVILREDVAKLGARGDVVKVADGFGRNYLLPRKLAMEATASNKAVVAQMRAASVRRSASDKADAELLNGQLEAVTLNFTRKTAEKGQLFGSVTSSDIADALAAKGFTIDRRKIQLDEPIKSVGEVTVPIKLHRDVTSNLKVIVEAEAVAAAAE